MFSGLYYKNFTIVINDACIINMKMSVNDASGSRVTLEWRHSLKTLGASFTIVICL